MHIFQMLEVQLIAVSPAHKLYFEIYYMYTFGPKKESEFTSGDS